MADCQHGFIKSWVDYISVHIHTYIHTYTYIYLEVYIQETSVRITATYPRLPSIHLSIHRIVRYVASSILGPVMVVLTTSSRAIIISAPILFCTSHWQYRREDRGEAHGQKINASSGLNILKALLYAMSALLYIANKLWKFTVTRKSWNESFFFI